MTRREFLKLGAAGVLEAGSGGLGFAWPADAAAPASSAGKADLVLRIAPVSLELAPGKTVRTTGYNGAAPGPILRMREGVPITVDVFNETGIPEVVHWHGQHVPAAVDGVAEEGTPFVPPHGSRRYTFTPGPAGTRWYHTHVFAGDNLGRGTYTGQFGFVCVEPKNTPGLYDREVFLALHEWAPFLTDSAEEDEEEEKEDATFVRPAGPVANLAPSKPNGNEVDYRYFSINGRALGHGEPIRVKRGERVLFHLLNASATRSRRIALPGHRFRVLALDGNPVPIPREMDTLELGVAERIDAIVEMDQPGVWILGTTMDEDRNAGMGIVVEYRGQKGAPRWVKPKPADWDYGLFGTAPRGSPEVEARFRLVFQKIPGGKGGFDRWTINGKSFPHTAPLLVRESKRYRLIFDNQSDDTHPMHLHRHSFELTKIYGKPTAGIMKDVVVVRPWGAVEGDFVADNPGLTLLHCHQQMHMNYGFMTLIKYV